MQALRHGLGAQQRIAGARKIFQQCKFGPRLLAVVAVHAHHVRFHRVRREFGVHFKCLLQQFPAHERDVFELRLFRAEQVGQGDERRFVLGEQQHASDIKVELVGVVEIIQIALGCPRFLGRDRGVQQLHQARTRQIQGVGRSQNPRRLFEREQMLVLEQHGDFPELAGGRRR